MLKTITPLTEDQKNQIIDLYFNHNFRVKQICEQMHLTPGRINRVLRYFIIELREASKTGFNSEEDTIIYYKLNENAVKVINYRYSIFSNTISKLSRTNEIVGGRV